MSNRPALRVTFYFWRRCLSLWIPGVPRWDWQALDYPVIGWVIAHE
jgi:hypothetical protein